MVSKREKGKATVWVGEGLDVKHAGFPIKYFEYS